MAERIKTTRAETPALQIFVGTSAGEDAEACVVLEHSIRSRASVPVDVTFMAPTRDESSPFYGWRTERWATPWTGFRWAVPALCHYRGVAVYFDCPTLVLGDVADLADAVRAAGKALLVRREGSVTRTGCLVWDCAAVRGTPLEVSVEQLRDDIGNHQVMGALLEREASLVGALPAGWGLRDSNYSQDPGSATGSVLFPRPALQPHVPVARRRLRKAGGRHWFSGGWLPHFSRPLAELWQVEFNAALAAGVSVDDYVPAEPYGEYEILETARGP